MFPNMTGPFSFSGLLLVGSWMIIENFDPLSSTQFPLSSENIYRRFPVLSNDLLLNIVFVQVRVVFIGKFDCIQLTLQLFISFQPQFVFNLI